MSDTFEVLPFVANVTDSEVVFRFDQASFRDGFEFPPNLEGMIASAVSSRPNLLDDRCVVIDLDNLPAISSKQLGAMLAVRKACDQQGKTHILRIRPNVCELLRVTKLADFFRWDDSDA